MALMFAAEDVGDTARRRLQCIAAATTGGHFWLVNGRGM